MAATPRRTCKPWQTSEMVSFTGAAEEYGRVNEVSVCLRFDTTTQLGRAVRSRRMVPSRDISA